jgi:hypothetical protein
MTNSFKSRHFSKRLFFLTGSMQKKLIRLIEASILKLQSTLPILISKQQSLGKQPKRD